MDLSEFENCILFWCSKNSRTLQHIEYVKDKRKHVDIHMYYTITNRYGTKRTNYECYQCTLNDDMTFKNVPHGLKGKVGKKKLIVMEENDNE